MYVFLFILVFAIIILIVYKSTINTPKEKKNSKKPVNKVDSSPQLYKEKGVKNFTIKGMQYLIDESYAGDFIGSVICENNKHDKYSVSVFNSAGVKIGYVPKGNHVLFNSLMEWHSGSNVAWGSIRYDDYHNKWENGWIEIPVGFSIDELSNLNNAIDAIKKRDAILQQDKVSTMDYLEIINDYYRINDAFEAIQKDLLWRNKLSKNIFPRLSKQLEKEKNWNELANLEKHKMLINELNAKYINSIEKRILKAKENLKKTE